MQLKHKGKVVEVTLTKPEQRVLEKACDLLEGIALLPCEHKSLADEASIFVAQIISALAKRDERAGPVGETE